MAWALMMLDKERLVHDGDVVVGVVSQFGRCGIVLLCDRTVPLHHGIDLICTGHGEGLTVVVATCSTAVACYLPLGLAELVSDHLVFSTFVGDDTRREEIQVLVGVAKNAAGVGHVVFVQLHSACSGMGPALAKAVVLGCYLTRLRLEVDAEAFKGTTRLRRDDVLVLAVVDADLRDMVAVERNHIYMVAQTGGILLAA